MERSHDLTPARSRIVNGESATEKDFVSQRSFVPTPYELTNWEIVGELAKERDFVPMEVSIVKGEESISDPMFDVFDGGLAAQGAELYIVSRGAVSLGNKLTEEEIAAAQAEERARVEAEMTARIEEARTEGFTRGHAEAQAAILSKYEALSAQLATSLSGIQAEWKNLADRLEQESLAFALQVSRKIVPLVSELRPEYIVDTIRQGLRQLGAAVPVRIRLSPQDFEFLNVIGLPVELSEGELGVTYVSDESIASGCIVETNYGELDLQLDQMWEQLRLGVEKAFRT